MNKNVIALAVAAGLAAPGFAAADVETYGRIYVQVYQIDNFGDAATGDSQIRQGDEQGHGRLGFKTSEDLGGGLKAFGKYEFQLSASDGEPAGGGDRIQQRDAFVGLGGGWGSVALGRFQGAYKTTGGVKYDPFVATVLQARGNGGMAAGALAQNSFLSDMIEYKSPKWGGFSFQLQYNLTDNDNNVDDNGEGDLLLGASFDIGKNHQIIAAYAQSPTIDEASQPLDGSNTKVGYKGAFGPFGLTLQYEMAEGVGAVHAGDYIYANGTWKVGKNLFVLAYGQQAQNDDVKCATTTYAGCSADKTYLALGGKYNFSKQTSLYYGYRTTNRDNGGQDQDEDVIAVGLRKDF